MNTPDAIATIKLETTLDYLKFYYDVLELNPIPLGLNSKISVIPWKPYQNKRINWKQVLEWYENGLFQNIGIITDISSNNFAVIDIDKTKYIPLEFLVEQMTFNDNFIGCIVRTGRINIGYQLWLKNKLPYGYYDKNNTEYQKKYGIEYFIKKHYIVAPPSIHPITKKKYKFIHLTDKLKSTQTEEIFKGILQHCIQKDPDQVLNKILSTPKRAEIWNILQNQNASHNQRLHLVGFLYKVLHLSEKEILEFISLHKNWNDKIDKTEYYIKTQIKSLDFKTSSTSSTSEIITPKTHFNIQSKISFIK